MLTVKNIELATLIHAISLHPYEINYRIAKPRPFCLYDLCFVKDDGIVMDHLEVEIVNLKPAIITALQSMSEQIDAAETRAKKAADEFDRYKKEHREFELFKKFKQERGF